MGSQYAAQLFNHFTMSQPAWETEISKGIFSGPHQWLKNQVFIHGKYFNSLELCNISTGKPFQMSEFIWYLENKFRIHHQTQPIKG
jgi:carboxypeptidase Taq